MIFKTIYLCKGKEEIKMSKITNGYAFAYQVLGYVMYESKKEKLDEIVIK